MCFMNYECEKDINTAKTIEAVNTIGNNDNCKGVEGIKHLIETKVAEIVTIKLLNDFFELCLVHFFSN